QLTGQRVRAEYQEAMRNLHRTAHIRFVVVVTSGIYADGPGDLQCCYASEWHPSAHVALRMFAMSDADMQKREKWLTVR
ncbi:hypothetical protein AAVH_40634, partial [Aphelenchoides avenae]